MKIQVEGQWFMRGDNGNWFATRLSTGSHAERVEPHIYPLLNEIAKLQARPEGARLAKAIRLLREANAVVAITMAPDGHTADLYEKIQGFLDSSQPQVSAEK